MKKVLKIALFLSAIGVSLSPFACKSKTENTRPTIEKITESVYASGIVESKNQYQVFSTVNGIIQKIWVKEGDLVKKGDPLFTIENEISKLQSDNAKLAADFAAFNTRGERLEEMSNAVQTAKSKMLNDSLMLHRQRGLWAQQIGSKVELEQRELAYIGSSSNYEATMLRYDDLKKQLNFTAAQSRKQLSISQKNAQDFTIRSKIDGRVYNITKEVGEVVNPQTYVAVMGAADDFWVELQIDENDIVRIKNGLRVLLTFDSYKKQVFEAVVSKIDPIMNERSRTFKVEAAFTKKPPVLYPNLTTEANILIFEKEKALTIPRAYLFADSLVMLENKEKRRVEIGLMDYQKVEILHGLEATETILKPKQ